MYGLGTYQVPADVLEELRAVFLRVEETRQKEEGRPQWLQAMSCCCGATERVSVPPYSFSVTEAETTSGMAWLWPADRKTFALFEPLFQAVSRAGLQVGPAGAAAGEPLQLWTATIIVRRSAILEAEATEFHTDYWHEDVPPGFAFSLLTPLLELPEGAGGLEYMPWTRPYDPSSGAESGEQKVHRVGYLLGQVVAVDGRCFHRTEPYRLSADSASSLRAIVSLDVHPRAPAQAAAACRESVRAQHDGDVYIRPNPWDDDAASTDASDIDSAESEA